MYYLILLNFLFFSLGQLTTISRSIGGFNIYFFDIFLFFTNLVLVFWIGMRGKFKINFPLIIFSIFLFFSLSLTLSQVYFYPIFEQIKILSYLIRFSQYFIFGYLLFNLVNCCLLDKPELRNIFVINFYFLSILNLLQLLFLNDLSGIAKFGWNPHIGRLTGTFLDPNFMAFYICLYFVLNHFYLKNKYIEYLSIFSIFATLSRNGIITLFVIYLLLNLKIRKKLIFLFLIASLFLIINPRIIERFSQFTDANDSSYVRLISWNEGIKVTNFSSYSGVGFNNYKNNLEFYRVSSLDGLERNSSNSTDSSFLHIFVTLGPVGFVMMLGLFLSFTYNSKFIIKNIVILLSLLFNSQFINSLFFPQIGFLIFIMLFLAYEEVDTFD